MEKEDNPRMAEIGIAEYITEQLTQPCLPLHLSDLLAHAK